MLEQYACIHIPDRGAWLYSGQKTLGLRLRLEQSQHKGCVFKGVKVSSQKLRKTSGGQNIKDTNGDLPILAGHTQFGLSIDNWQHSLSSGCLPFLFQLSLLFCVGVAPSTFQPFLN